MFSFVLNGIPPTQNNTLHSTPPPPLPPTPQLDFSLCPVVIFIEVILLLSPKSCFFLLCLGNYTQGKSSQFPGFLYIVCKCSVNYMKGNASEEEADILFYKGFLGFFFWLYYES